MYAPETDLIKRRRVVGLTNQRLGMILGRPASTVSAKLRGYAPLTEDERRLIVDAIEAAEEEQGAEARECA